LFLIQTALVFRQGPFSMKINEVQGQFLKVVMVDLRNDGFFGIDRNCT
jgi:hypothetical protein